MADQRIPDLTLDGSPADTDELVVHKSGEVRAKKTTRAALCSGLVVSAGVSGGQTVTGGTGSGDDLTLLSTSHATKGNVHLGTASTYDQVNDRLGIGTQSPDKKLTIIDQTNYRSTFEADAANGQALSILQTANDTPSGSPFYIAKRSRGTVAAPTALASGDELFRFGAIGHDGTTYDTQRKIMVAATTEAWTATNRGFQLSLFTRDNGTAAAPTERMTLTQAGNIKIAGSATRATTEGTNHLDIFNGTAPVGTLTNGVSLYSTSGELRVMDAAGNSPLLSPHDADTNEWVFYSKNTVTGKVVRIDMERMMRALDALLGGGFVSDQTEDPTT